MAATTSTPDLGTLVERVTSAALGAAEVAVGLGILGVNRVQALRRQGAARLAEASRRTSAGTPADESA